MASGSAIARTQLILGPTSFLRAEALCALVGSCFAYHTFFPHQWKTFFVFFLLPDLTFLIYVVSPKVIGSLTYNLAHTYVLPASLGSIALHSRDIFLGRLCLIWIAHIGLDRLLGLGLKYPNAVRFTHLQSVAGPPKSQESVRAG